MKKKEDLKKHLSGEKTGLKAGHWKNSFILFFLLFSELSYSQIPINGFCALETHLLPKGYQGIISADINFDGDEELILYSATLKRIGIFSPAPVKENELVEFQLNSEISQLRQLKDKGNGTNLFVSAQRRLRKVSILYISPDSLSEKKGEITFDSYPENVYTGDIDLNGTEEILVSGSGFDGLSVLFRSEESMGEKKIISGTSFSEAIFIDLNDDGYPDVLAFNILENSLQYFYNNTNGDFRLERSTNYPIKINLLRAMDFDKDGFQDIIYSAGSSTEILFGDFQSAYEKKATIQLNTKPDGIQFGNYNGDKFVDIAYINSSQGMLNVNFGKADADFHESITYLQKPFFSSFTKFNYHNSENIACFSESGELMVISSIKEFDRDMRVIPAIEPGAVKKFDYGNDGTPDISFVDEYDNSLKVFLNNEKGIPSVYYSFPLEEDHKEILVDEFFKRRKTFYCYTKGTPFIEVFRYNFSTDKFNRKQLYAPGEILDITLQHVDSSLVNVFMVYNKESKLYLGKFENRDLSVTFREYPFIDRNVSFAEIFIKENPEIYYWKSEGDSFHFKKVEVKSPPNIYKTFYQVQKSDSLIINLYGADSYSNEYPSVVSLVQNQNEKSSLVISGDELNNSIKLFNSTHQGNRKFLRGFFGETSVKGIINFTVNTADDGYINKLVYSERGKAHTLNRMLAAENVSDYFLAKLDQKKYYLVYSNKKEGCLSITSVKK
jgi:hypothetical protein